MEMPKPSTLVEGQAYGELTKDAPQAVATPDEAKLVSMCDAQWREAHDWMAPAHQEAREHRAFYDGDQWTAEEKRDLKNRPASVTNQISRAIDNITGRERAMRFDYKAHPVGEADVPRAAEVTYGLKHITTQTNSKYTFSDAFEDAAKGPMGWIAVGLDDADPTKEPIAIEAPDPFEMFFDPYSRLRDFSDCRYVIRRRVVDLDLAKRAYANKGDDLDAAVVAYHQNAKPEDISRDYGGALAEAHTAVTLGGGNKTRKRVCVREHWYWETENAEFIVMPDGEVYDWDPADPMTARRLMEGGQHTTGQKRCFYMAVVANGVLLHHEKSPYPWARFPYIPVWCKRDREGRPYGLIRVMRNPQEELNVAWSKLGTIARSRWLIAQPGALGATTMAQAAEAIAKDNFVLEVANPNGIQLGSDKGDASLWLNMLETRRREIDESVGNNEAAYGDKSNEKSGVAIERRVMQQALNLGKVFDSYRWARLYAGEMLLSLAQKFYTPQKWARIIEAETLQTKQPIDLSWVRSPLVSSIGQMKFNVVIEDQAETATERQSAQQFLIDTMPFLPDPAKAALAVETIRASEAPNKEQIASKVEQAMMPPAPPMPPPMDPAAMPMDPSMVPPPPPVPPDGGILMSPEGVM